jgi:hypothetical protein
VEKKLIGLPTPVEIPTKGSIEFGPFQKAKQSANAYMVAKAGSNYSPPCFYTKVDERRAWRIACAYENANHNPTDAKVKASYYALIKETLGQYQFIKNTKLHIELIDFEKTRIDPYAASPRLAHLDVIQNNHLWVTPTLLSFGADENYEMDNPLLAMTNEYIEEYQLCANDVFRIVHDYYGHIAEGIGFRAEGEENAWRCHAAMYSEKALGALTTELRGQNSWVNYGPSGYANRKAKAAETVYAEQKACLMPSWTWHEGRADPPH